MPPAVGPQTIRSAAVKDVTPPTITVLRYSQSDTPYRTTGDNPSFGIITTVPVNTEFVDPGAT